MALTGLTLRWLAARAAASYEVYLGETGTVPVRVATVTSPSFKPGALKPSTNYQWRVDTLPPSGVRVTGPAWSFTTK